MAPPQRLKMQQCLLTLVKLCVFVHAGLISAFPMFGSSFFYIQSSSSTTFFAPCIIAVNQHGLHFLHKTTHVRNDTQTFTITIFKQWNDSSHRDTNITPAVSHYFQCYNVCLWVQELMTVVPLVEVQSSRTQRPTAGTSYPYVDLTVGDVNTQRVIQLQLEQVLHQKQTRTLFIRDYIFSGVVVLMSVVFVRRAWSCVESSPCRWKTWCLCERRDSPCHPAKSPCCNTSSCFIVRTHTHTHMHQTRLR